MNVIESIHSFNRNDYQRDNFDAFLKKIKFSYNVPSIHIAGTNGKGSVATFLKDIYSENGYRVGLFTSPDEFHEMIKINDSSINDEYVERLFNEYKKLFEKYDLSAAEIETFIAFSYFKDNNADLAVIECMMGGEYDATNIFNPILSIITSISIEHSDFLGVSLGEIAMHKCGIIKDSVPVLLGDVEGDALNVAVNKCKEERAKLIMVDQYHHYRREEGCSIFDYRPYYDLKISSLAKYRVYNASIAVEATNILMDKFPVQEDKLKSGLLKSKLKCRFEVVNNGRIILDGAHNPHGINSLRKEMDENLAGKHVHVLFAAFKDKNIALMLPEIGLIGDVTLTTFDNGRARKEEDYFIYLEDYRFVPNYEEEIMRLLEEYPNDILLITGSLTFTYVVRDFLKKKGML